MQSWEGQSRRDSCAGSHTVQGEREWVEGRREDCPQVGLSRLKKESEERPLLATRPAPAPPGSSALLMHPASALGVARGSAAGAAQAPSSPWVGGQGVCLCSCFRAWLSQTTFCQGRRSTGLPRPQNTPTAPSAMLLIEGHRSSRGGGRGLNLLIRVQGTSCSWFVSLLPLSPLHIVGAW